MLSPTNKMNWWNRRQFVSSIIAGTAGTAFISLPKSILGQDLSKNDITVQQVIDRFINTGAGAPFKETVDTIKTGDASQKVTGIVTTMLATIDVIVKAVQAGANFIIVHEPTFYNHRDETKWLKNDVLYQYKVNLLRTHGIVIWRCHDYIHAHLPDGILTGMLMALKWEKYYNALNPGVISIAPENLDNIIKHIKKNLGISHVRFIGKLTQMCTKIILIPGASGGTNQIQSVQKEKPDLLIVGEVNEWETSEYIRDLQKMEKKTSLLVLGHIVSEEAGMVWMQMWLKDQFPEITSTHIPSGEAFEWA